MYDGGDSNVCRLGTMAQRFTELRKTVFVFVRILFDENVARLNSSSLSVYLIHAVLHNFGKKIEKENT